MCDEWIANKVCVLQSWNWKMYIPAMCVCVCVRILWYIYTNVYMFIYVICVYVHIMVICLYIKGWNIIIFNGKRIERVWYTYQFGGTMRFFQWTLRYYCPSESFSGLFIFFCTKGSYAVIPSLYTQAGVRVGNFGAEVQTNEYNWHMAIIK